MWQFNRIETLFTFLWARWDNQTTELCSEQLTVKSFLAGYCVPHKLSAACTRLDLDSSPDHFISEQKMSGFKKVMWKQMIQ